MMSKRRAHSEDREPFLENILSALRFRRVIRHIPKNSKVLDLGCGYNAKFLRKLSGKKCECIGLDVSVDHGSSSEGVTLVEHDLNEAFPFADKSFDVVTSLANLEHLQNPEASLLEIYRVLKPGGILLLTAPSVYAKPVLEFLSFRLHLVSENEISDHKNYFNRKSLLDLCKKAGFSRIEHSYFQLFMNNFIRAVKNS